MAVPQLDKNGKAVGNVELPSVFDRKPKLSVLHQAVSRQLASRRVGTADTKTRDEVSGGGRKPWRQKGTGRARHGSIRSPIWRTGGVVFGPHPRSFAFDMNKSARRSALAMAVAAKAADGSLSVIDIGDLKPAKCKDLLAVIWPEDKRDSVALVIDVQRDPGAREIMRSGRNVAKLHVLPHGELSVYALLAHERVIISKQALDALAEVCGA